jgi:hypothetical protein
MALVADVIKPTDVRAIACEALLCVAKTKMSQAVADFDGIGSLRELREAAVARHQLAHPSGLPTRTARRQRRTAEGSSACSSRWPASSVVGANPPSFGAFEGSFEPGAALPKRLTGLGQPGCLDERHPPRRRLETAPVAQSDEFLAPLLTTGLSAAARGCCCG